MWFFGKDKKKDGKAADAKSEAASGPLTSKQAKTQALMAQMRVLRAEIGEENLQELVKKLKLEELKKQVRHDIDNDPAKRQRLLDEIRWHVHDDHGSDTRH